MKFPETTKEKSVENIHGHVIEDDYKWLENSDSRRVKDWVRKQNKFTEMNVPSSIRRQYEAELVSEYDFTDVGLPYMYGELYFWQQREPGQDQAVLYVKKGMNGKPRVLINPNELNNGSKQTMKLDYWIPSPRGTYLAYGISKDGDEMTALSVLDVNTSEKIEFVAPNTGWLSLCWLRDESGFYYTAYPEKGTVPKGKELMGAKILFHLLGTKSSEDKYIFGKNRPKEDLYGLSLSYDDKWLIIAASRDWSRNDLYVYDSAKKKVNKLITGRNALFSVSFSKDKAIMYTNYKANSGRLLVSEPNKMSSNVENWNDFVGERKEKLEWYSVTADKILIAYQRDVSQILLSYDHSGREIEALPTADHSSLYGVSTSLESSEFFYQYASFVSSPTINRYEPATGKISLYHRSKTVIDEKDYTVEQEWCTSKDGTKVPMFIIHRKEIERNGKNPVLLTAYGGFNYSNLPYFLRSYLPWLKRGGVYVVANIRGGGEFGEKWHEEGKLT